QRGAVAIVAEDMNFVVGHGHLPYNCAQSNGVMGQFEGTMMKLLHKNPSARKPKRSLRVMHRVGKPSSRSGAIRAGLCVCALLALSQSVLADGLLQYFDDSADAARASQPDWSSPLSTTTALMEQR